MGLRQKLRSGFSKTGHYNMYSDKGEAFYYRVYRHYMDEFLKPGMNVLDIGCQFGRFTIPMAAEGCKVTATDIQDHYFSTIKQNLGSRGSVEFFKEDIRQTLRRCKGEKFDAILCLELLYTLPDYASLLPEMAALLSPGSILFSSHRSIGYYLYRFSAEGKSAELEQLSTNTHPYFNAQSTEQLAEVYGKAGLRLKMQRGIGLFSGIGSDPFQKLNDPSKMSAKEQDGLFRLETGEESQRIFLNNARYILTASTLP